MLITYITATYKGRPVSHLKLSDTNVINVLEMHLHKLIAPVKLIPFMSDEPFAGELELTVTTVPDFIDKINAAIRRTQDSKNRMSAMIGEYLAGTQFTINARTEIVVQLRSRHSTTNVSVVDIHYRPEIDKYTITTSYTDDFPSRVNIRFTVADIPRNQLAAKIKQLDEFFESTTKRLQLLYNVEE